jgi:hypothetical protein
MNVIKPRLTILCLIACSSMYLTSCYRMPTENDFSLVPTTNNPAITCEKNNTPIPGVGY